MGITRRHMAVGGALALGAASLLRGTAAIAESADEAAVAAAIEALRKAMLDADKARLADMTAEQLSYGHSSGTIQSKAEFIDVIVSKKTIYKSISLSDPVNTIAGNNAIARHVFTAETESGGKPNSSKIGVLQVWQKQDGHWKLLARQAFKL